MQMDVKSFLSDKDLSITAAGFICVLSFSPLVDTEGRKLKGGIQRSTETGLAVEMPSRTVRQASHESIEDSMNSYGSEGK